jgi:hypothetical protein
MIVVARTTTTATTTTTRSVLHNCRQKGATPMARSRPPTGRWSSGSPEQQTDTIERKGDRPSQH